MGKERRDDQPKTNYNANRLHKQTSGTADEKNRQKSTKND